MTTSRKQEPRRVVRGALPSTPDSVIAAMVVRAELADVVCFGLTAQSAAGYRLPPVTENGDADPEMMIRVSLRPDWLTVRTIVHTNPSVIGRLRASRPNGMSAPNTSLTRCGAATGRAPQRRDPAGPTPGTRGVLPQASRPTIPPLTCPKANWGPWGRVAGRHRNPPKSHCAHRSAALPPRRPADGAG